MTEAGEAFYLLYYANDDSEDYFIERSPEGALRRIEKPENLLHLGFLPMSSSSSTAA